MKPLEEITFADIKAYVQNSETEGLQLEFKSGGLFNDLRDIKNKDARFKREDEIKMEITRDVSAFANAIGGYLIYGIEEEEKEGQKVAGKLTAVRDTEWNRGRFLTICDNIQSNIQGLGCKQIPNEDGTGFFLVVWIPESTTAHQAKDRVYYRRRADRRDAMLNHEVREVMGRESIPDFEVQMQLLPFDGITLLYLVSLKNTSNAMAVHWCAEIILPIQTPFGLLTETSHKGHAERNGHLCVPISSHQWGPCFPHQETTIDLKLHFAHFSPQYKALPIVVGVRIYAQRMATLRFRAELRGSNLGWVKAVPIVE